MPRLPAVRPRKLIKVLKNKGFVLDRVKGSHHILKRGDISVTVPFHNRDLGRGLTKSILDDAEISVEEFIKLL